MDRLGGCSIGIIFHRLTRPEARIARRVIDAEKPVPLRDVRACVDQTVRRRGHFFASE
jgi:hypothetical protein